MVSRRYDLAHQAVKKSRTKKPTLGRGARRMKLSGWQFRVVIKREGWKAKSKLFGRYDVALRYYRIITSDRPWEHFKYPQEADDQHHCKALEPSCICRQRVRKHGGGFEWAPGTNEDYSRTLRAQWPPIEYCRIETRPMGAWAPAQVTPIYHPTITNPRRMLPAHQRYQED